MLITNGALLTFNQNNDVITDGAILIEDNVIAAVGTTAELRAAHPEEEVLDAGGKVVMPGLLCAHTHFYGAFARGMPFSGEAPANFPQILERIWWRLDKALRPEDIRYSAYIFLLDAIKNGCTTIIDHHASPNAIDGSLDVIAEAAQEAGVRCSLCYEVTDRDGKERAIAGIRENERFIKKVQQARRAGKETDRTSLLGATFGLHASLTLSDQTLAKCVETAAPLGTGFHIHVAEDMADVEQALKISGRRVVERLAQAGILGAKTIAAHCVHINESEMQILKETGTRVVHNPRSNMNNAVGVSPVLEMLGRGIEVGLGNDGFSMNMFQEMKVGYLLPKLAKRDPRVLGVDQILAMAFHHNAATAASHFELPHWPPKSLSPAVSTAKYPFSELSPGAYADIVLLDYDPPTPLHKGNAGGHLIFAIDGSNVVTTIANGKILLKDRQLLTLDEERIAARARQLAPQVWARL